MGTSPGKSQVQVSNLLSFPVISRAAVVVVDGRPSNRAIYAQVAASLGELVQVHSFSTASEALRWLDTRSADLVITASTMADLNGIEFLKVLRKQPLNGKLSAIVITADRDARLRERMLAAGATAVLHSPVGVRELQTHFRSLLRPGR